jgi:ABC-2 type transport system ATP-binding protein
LDGRSVVPTIGVVDDASPVQCRALTKRYGAVVAVSELDLEVQRGAVTGFLGPNASGKTTTLRLLAGLTRPTSGSATRFGEPAGSVAARRHLGYMPADPAFLPALSGEENLDLLSDLQGAPPVDRDWAADLLGLDRAALRRRVGGWSSGMTQKLGLVQAVQHRPDLVVLDEPANRLDPLAHRRFEQLVREIADAGRTVFLSSHSLSEVQAVCDRVAMIRAGRLLAAGPIEQLAAAELRRVRARLRRPVAAIPPGLVDVSVTDGELVGRLPAGRTDVLRALLADEAVEDLLVEPAGLEETFVHLYADSA